MAKTKDTRRAQGEGTIYRKTVKRGEKEYSFWEAQLTVTDPTSGKQTRKSFTAKTQREAVAKLKAASAKMEDGAYFEPAKITLGAWLDLWLKDYCADKKYRTVKHYKAQCETHIKPALGAVKLSKLTPPMVQSFYNELGKTGKKIIKRDKKTGKETVTFEPLAAKSIRNIHCVLTKALNVAIDVGYLKTNPTDRVTLPRKERKEINPLDDTQVAAFYREAGNDDLCYLLRLFPFTGLRESEATGLTWDCVNFEEGTLKINKQLVKRTKEAGGYTLAETKNSKTRVIKPAQMVMQQLKLRQAEQIQQRFNAGELWEGWQTEKERQTAPVFTTETGGFLSPKTVYKHCKKILKKIGAGDRCVHDLRHTYAVLSLQNGDSPKIVQGNLGHASASFTLDVYGHVSERMKEDSSARMERYMQNMA